MMGATRFHTAQARLPKKLHLAEIIGGWATYDSFGIVTYKSLYQVVFLLFLYLIKSRMEDG